GEVLAEKDAVKKWGALFTPFLMFFPEESDGTLPADELAVATMPGAFGPATTRNLLTWVLEKGYDGEEPFQKYHARKFEESKN
ncbi:MAG: thioredoxin, partial [Pseudomonadota bacterium]|nr:thioredoxin [Pseudomonadota bacterium]